MNPILALESGPPSRTRGETLGLIVRRRLTDGLGVTGLFT